MAFWLYHTNSAGTRECNAGLHLLELPIQQPECKVSKTKKRAFVLKNWDAGTPLLAANC